MLRLAGSALQHRVSDGVRSGKLDPQAAAISRVSDITFRLRLTSIKYEIAGSRAAAWDDEDGAGAESGEATKVNRGRLADERERMT